MSYPPSKGKLSCSFVERCRYEKFLDTLWSENLCDRCQRCQLNAQQKWVHSLPWLTPVCPDLKRERYTHNANSSTYVRMVWLLYETQQCVRALLTNRQLCSVFMFLSTLLDSVQKRRERDAKFKITEDIIWKLDHKIIIL